ncbi:flagella basal body P-ring formation protein FlgA [Sphingomonas sp.]|uniref:flagella basal body P-ring formation protein FlgA n=1 Tax=Sphingomonas sp. TaxID=28214 RepID=UPI003B003227
MIPLLLLAPLSLGAFQDVPSLDRAVAAFTGRPVGAEGGARAALDARLRLAQCPTVALSWRSDAHDAVVVTCSGPDWRVFVPVLRATPVAAAGPAPSSVAAPIRAPVAAVIPVIRRGDPVLIEAGTDGFQITRAGVAATDAVAGARVAVRVEGATQPVQAVAIESGRATLPGFVTENR